jgi:membrane protease subunit (stomatin/prohibitin family)
MGIFDVFRGQFIDIIEWLDDSGDTLAYRFERHGNEIKNGAKLVVRPGQEAIFVNEGQVEPGGDVADAFTPGTYTLETKNLPVLSTLQGWKYGFNSPFKAEVYFFSTKVFTSLKWGTANPITLRDPELGPVRLRAYGTYTMRIADPAKLLEQLVSTDSQFQTGEISDQLRSFILSRFAGWLAGSGISVYDFAARYGEIGAAMVAALKPDFAQYGLEVQSVVIENIGLPPEVEQALDKRTAMGIVGDLNRYTQFQAANAVEQSAKNPAGGNPALDLAMGVALGQQVAQSLQHGAVTGSQEAPPPLPNAAWYAAVSGAQEGPHDAAALQARIGSGAVTRDTLVWKQGLANWTKAGEITELAPLFAAVPPPLPPSA